MSPWTRDEVIEELDEAHRRLERNAAAEIRASTKYASLLIDIRKLIDEARNEKVGRLQSVVQLSQVLVTILVPVACPLMSGLHQAAGEAG